MLSLVSVNVSFNRLRGSLPAKWVKFLKSHPDSFRGNPGLCLEYNAATSQCMTKSVPRKTKNTIAVMVGIAMGAAFILAFLIASLCWWMHRSTPPQKLAPPLNEIFVKNFTKEPLPFTFEEIMAVTRDLDDAYIRGEGGHGVVYKVESATSATPIAVKRITWLDMAGALIRKSFWNEIETIGNAKHRNLVKMLGFIKCGRLGLLLYEYVSSGDLHSALHKEDHQGCKELSRKARLHIAQGVADGLACLHHDYENPIVHRGIKSSNVLLDRDLEARISDFGLAKIIQASAMQPQSQQQWLSSLNISGTFGYIAPEVGYGTPVTTKLDGYSFGVLLLELLTGRHPANASYGEAWHVVAWVRASVEEYNDIMNESLFDPLLSQPTNIAFKREMMCVQRIALLCTNDVPSNRPTMRDIVELLKLHFEREEMEDMADMSNSP